MDVKELKAALENNLQGLGCGKTTGHGYSCDKHYICPECSALKAQAVPLLELLAENERYRKYGCDTCDGSGHLHRADGEYFGECTSCGAYELEQAKRERDQLKAENEALRKALTDIRENSSDLGACECAADALADSRKVAQ